MKWKRPPGRRTRAISAIARGASGMVHSVNVLSALGTASSASGMRSPSSPMNSIGMSDAAIRSAPRSRPRVDGSTARIRVTSGGYRPTLRPEPNPTSTTSPLSPAVVSRRSGTKAFMPQQKFTRWGTTRCSTDPRQTRPITRSTDNSIATRSSRGSGSRYRSA